jgi:hypothetical protein
MKAYLLVWKIKHHRYKEAEADMMQDYRSSLYHGNRAETLLSELKEMLS